MSLKHLKQQAVRELRELAFYGELAGENVFKTRALSTGADLLESLSDSEFNTRLQNNTLMELKGIGKGILAHLEDLKLHGHMRELKAFHAKYPESLLELHRVPGLGPKKIKTLFDELSIASLSELEYACVENRLTKIKGFGEATQKKILENILHLRAQQDLFLGVVAWQESQELLTTLARKKGVLGAWVSGEVRRRLEVVTHIDFILHTESKDISSELSKTFSKSESGIPLRFHGVSASSDIPFALFRQTATPAHFQAVEASARQTGLSLTSDGLFQGKKRVALSTEEDIYQKVGVHFVPPELREGIDEIIPLSKKFPFPKVLLEEEEIDGALHNHTTESDGANTLEEMIQHAVELNWKWIGISDHSGSAFYANGLTGQRLKAQHEEILKLRKKYTSIKIYHGVESDILADGSLDYPDSVLKSLDFVIASVHSSMNQTSEVMTERLCRALSHPATTVLGHPTGRLLLGRKGFQFNWERVLETALKNNKAIELNANPHRLDIDWRVLRNYRDSGPFKIAISADAHSCLGMDDLKTGVGVARKGGLDSSRILRPADFI